MILTVTMNPSVDISYSIKELKLDDINRVSQVSKTAGGKGLNVTRVVHELGGPVKATGIVGGHLGNQLKEQLDSAGIEHDFYPISQEIRNSIAILHNGNNQTEILETGPTMTKAEIAGLLAAFQRLLSKTKLLTISGSLAKGLSTDFYAQLIMIAKEKGIDTLLDTSGEALKEALIGNEKPKLIKPNLTEINDLLQLKLDSKQPEKLKQALNHPLFEGVEWIVVTLGGNGAIVKHDNLFYRAMIPKIDVINPVGSGDATIAGLAYALSRYESDEEIIKTGMTTGMLNALESVTGHINTEHFQTLYSQITVEAF
ncbi:hexose kinase [Carnobacterium sp. ISL-102]|uniref:hexose kinase n=1 Tax=Carnobacterium sp. ISL-102 TaxID=2819142 RepID=UPI001BE5373D|nr:hexose kinase [Carnobacterium sp. ISL-102]MBT2733072.1 hexose kinase [Carnobacterium sp. ISL-102]